MAMSKDRVEFKLPAHKLRERKVQQLLKETLGIDEFPSTYGCDHVITFVCRPSQFARFLIRRNELNFQNSFKELEPRLFTPEEAKVTRIDASCNRNCCPLSDC